MIHTRTEVPLRKPKLLKFREYDGRTFNLAPTTTIAELKEMGFAVRLVKANTLNAGGVYFEATAPDRRLPQIADYPKGS